MGVRSHRSHDDHKTCSIEAIRPGGEDRALTWNHDGGFDNHRWASNNQNYIVVVDEVDQERLDVTYPVVMRADGSRSTRLGNTRLLRTRRVRRFRGWGRPRDGWPEAAGASSSRGR